MSQTNDRKAIKAAEKKSRQVDVQRGEVVKRTMATYDGREWVWTQLESASVFKTVFHENPIIMAFTEGQRNSGLQLLSDVMEFAPDRFTEAMREAHGRREYDAAESRKRSPGETGDGGIEGSGRQSGGGRIVPDADAPGGFRIEPSLGSEADGDTEGLEA